MAGIDDLNLPVKFLGDLLRLFFRFGVTPLKSRQPPAAPTGSNEKIRNLLSAMRPSIGVRMHEF
jgi:hypothetical protein